ncbi:MAG: hypothetical protein QG570_378 [Patescibacteria group bacterium]|jgi:hypothetical protein|nr:hypothetical protein [Patescibacteria group bacterium]
MANLSSNDKVKLERLFGMGSGYVLDFSNRSFQEFIITCCRKDIFNERYNQGSGSKANRLRLFWNIELDSTVGKLLLEMLEYWRTQKAYSDSGIPKGEEALYKDCLAIAQRLSGLSVKETSSEEEFLQKQYEIISVSALNIDGNIGGVVNQRIKEIDICMKAKAPLAAIFLAGSTLEGILLNTAINNPKAFNQSPSAPKDKGGKVLNLNDWKLSQLIDVACEIGLLDLDIKKFSHSLRDFRNYIHPYEQALAGFNPDDDTAKICWQVLKAAVTDLSKTKI